MNLAYNYEKVKIAMKSMSMAREPETGPPSLRFVKTGAHRS